jgi:hypothetical protein
MSLCWSVDGERVVSGSDDGTIRVWDVESGDTVLGPINTGHENVFVVIYSPDTTKIATGGYKETALKIWDAKTGNLLSAIKHDSTVWSLAWTSDQKKLIASSYPSIRIFDTATWQQIAILEGHTFTVDCLSFVVAGHGGCAGRWRGTLTKRVPRGTAAVLQTPGSQTREVPSGFAGGRRETWTNRACWGGLGIVELFIVGRSYRYRFVSFSLVVRAASTLTHSNSILPSFR